MSALTIDSGSYPLITRTDRRRNVDTPQPSPWLSAGALALGGIGIAAASGILIIIFALAASRLPSTGRSLLLATAAVLLGLAGVLEIAAWTARVIGRRQQVMTAAICRRVDAAVGMARTAALLEQISARLGNLEQALGERLDRIEQRQDDMADAVQDIEVVAEALGRVRNSGNGQVVALHPPNGVNTPGQRRPR